MTTKAKTKTAGKRITKAKKKKIMVTTLAVGAAGILGYFGWQYYQKKSREKKAQQIPEGSIATASGRLLDLNIPLPTPKKIQVPSVIRPRAKSSSTTSPKTGAAHFPLKKGSKGETVRRMQLAIIEKYGSSYLPKYGADGDFGSETVNALKKIGLPTTVTESTFNVLTEGAAGSTGKSEGTSLGKQLYSATSARDFAKALAIIKKFSSKEDYSEANEEFKTYRINGVRQTIVNALLSTFSAGKEQQQIRFEFLRMGLQFDGNKWSLSGIDGRSIVTATPTTVWMSATSSVEVPAAMVLGNEVTRRLDYTLFENKGKFFLVPSRSIRYL